MNGHRQGWASPRRPGSGRQGYSRDMSFSRSRSASRSRSSRPESSKIVIERLTRNVTETHVREIFGKYGTIAELTVPMNQTFHVNRGVAHLTYTSALAAEDAISHMHEGQLDGETLHVSIVLPRRAFPSSPPPARRITQDRYGSSNGHRPRDHEGGGRSFNPRYRDHRMDSRYSPSPGRNDRFQPRSPPRDARRANDYHRRSRSVESSRSRSYSRSQSRSRSRSPDYRDDSRSRSPRRNDRGPRRRRSSSPSRNGRGSPYNARRRRDLSRSSYGSNRSRPRRP